MRADRPLRIPLQIGTSSLTSLALGTAYFVPGSVLVAAPVTVMIVLGIDGGDAIGYILLPGLFLCTMAWKHLRRAVGERPSDLLLTSDGFEIRGGPNAGRQLDWSELTGVKLETPAKSKAKEEDDSDLRQLCVYKGSERIQLAAADQPGEQSSLEELKRTLEAGRRPPAERGPRAPAEADATSLLVCPECRAAVAPANASTVVCPYCHATVPVTEEIRKLLRDAADVARRPDAKVAKLLDQPGAGFVSGILTGAAVFMLASWPAALVIATLNYLHDAFTLAGTGYLLLFVASCIVGFFGVIRGRLVDRQALRLVALDFGAIPPAAPGKPYLCRQCLAPLPPQSEQVLVSCMYCRADNVLGIDLHRDADVAREERQSLAEALQRRTRERRRWRGVSLAGVALLVLSGFSLRHGIGHNETTWPLDQKCKQNDFEACVALADLLSKKDATEWSFDPVRAAELFSRGCDAGIVHACVELVGSTKDPLKQKLLRVRACQLGDAETCDRLERGLAP